MTYEAREALARLAADPNGRSPLGYGPPSALTRELIAADCITIEHVERSAIDNFENVSGLWYAQFTPTGRRIVSL